MRLERQAEATVGCKSRDDESGEVERNEIVDEEGIV